MKILRISEDPKTIIVIPRIFPNIGDTLIITLRNEMTNITEDINHTWDYMNNYFSIYLEDSNFLELYSKYELIIYREANIIYKGKMMIINDTDSIQDFKRTSIVNKKIRI